MRHGISGNKLSRNQTLRKATVRDIAKATILKERICTTQAKAKEARKLVDKLITMGKKGTLAEKRRAFAVLCDHKIVSDLFSQTAPRFKNRVGGYTRIIPLGNRRGDNARLALLELTEKAEIIVSTPKSSAASEKKDLKPTKIKDATLTVDTENVQGKESSKDAVKDESLKSASSKSDVAKDKGAAGKKIVGGLKKMFNRKSSGNK